MASVGGIGKNLLITGHAGVEYDFSGRDARCAEWKTFVDSAVAQDEIAFQAKEKGYLARASDWAKYQLFS